MNSGGLRTKINDLVSAVNCSVYDVIIIVESNLCDSINDGEIQCENYVSFRSDRSSETSDKTRGGGVLIYVKKSIDALLIPTVGYQVEQLFVLCNVAKQKVIIGGVYIPPNQRNIVYESHCLSVEYIFQKYPNFRFVLFGDYNLPEATWSNDAYGVTVNAPINSNAHMVAENFGFLKLYQVNTIPNDRGIYLDLTFTNVSDLVINRAGDPIFDASYHHVPYDCNVQLNNKTNESLSVTTYYYDFKNCDFTGINNFLGSVE